jgi:hypothetical protein
MQGDWRIWRPAIWLVMLGIAVALVVNPWWLSAVFFGAAIGSAIQIRKRRQRAALAASKRPPQRRRRSGGKR